MQQSTILQGDGFFWQCREGSDDTLGPAPHEKPLEKTMRGLLPEGGVFMDIGAHVGHYSVRFAGSCSKVIALEANPETAARLQRNLDLNLIENVDIHVVAAWDSFTTLKAWDPWGAEAGGSTRVLGLDEEPQRPANAHEIVQDPDAMGTLDAGEVKAVPVDWLDLNTDRIDLVKIDVEGAEAHVVRGGENTWRKYRPKFWIEMHDRMYGAHIRTETIDALKSLDYDVSVGGVYANSEYLLGVPR